MFSAAVAAQDDKFVPIMSSYYLLGGSQNGKWLTAEALAPRMKGTTKMTTLNLSGIRKTGVNLTNTGEEYGACIENTVFKFDPEVEADTEASLAVGENAKWNLVPRVPQEIAATDKTYANIATAFLKTKGIARPKINLDQILQVDLEGDGRMEILMTGNFYKKGMTELPGAGDYSFALLRKIVNGRARNVLIEGEFFTRNRGDYSPPNERRIFAVADLNGDGKMEIVLDSTYYEGGSETVFEITGGKPSRVLEVSCGA